MNPPDSKQKILNQILIDLKYITNIPSNTSMDNVSVLKELLNEIKVMTKGKYKPFYVLID